MLRLAQVDAPISIATKYAMPGLGIASTVARVSRAIYEESWYQIVARNENMLHVLRARCGGKGFDRCLTRNLKLGAHVFGKVAEPFAKVKVGCVNETELGHSDVLRMVIG